MKCWEVWNVFKKFCSLVCLTPGVFSEDEWERWQQAAGGLHGQSSGLSEVRRLHGRTNSIWSLCAGRHPTFGKARQCESPHTEKPVLTFLQDVFNTIHFKLVLEAAKTKLLWSSRVSRDHPITLNSSRTHRAAVRPHVLALRSHLNTTLLILVFILEINPVSHSETEGV